MTPLPVSRTDFDEWLAMRQSLYTGLDKAFHLAEMEAIFSSREMACFIGWSEAGDEVVGMIELSLRNLVDGCASSPVGYIEGLYVKPAFRGRRYGRQLASFADSWFVNSGCREAATDSELENTAAQDFFRRLGYSETWRIVEFKKTIA